MSLLFVDTNIPIYAVGRPHRLKAPCSEVLELIAQHPLAFVTDVEVLQELLHRYLSLRLWPAPGLAVVERFEVLMRDRVEAIDISDVLAAAHAASVHPGLSARDLLHVAVARRVGASAIVTADRGFQGVSGIARLDPGNVLGWRELVIAN